MPEKQVLGHGHFRHQMQLLMDDCDPIGNAFGRGLEGQRLFADLQVTATGDVRAPENFQECGFARAVFAHERMHLPRISDKTDIGQRLHPGEAFSNPIEAQAGASADRFLPDCLLLHSHLDPDCEHLSR